METGERGEGGDRTLEIDAAAEQLVFDELERLHAAGARFCAVSEERGVVDFGDAGVLVVVDPIDGSMNAKRGMPHHALSIAVAEGPTMGDVVFGYVRDFGPREEWVAWRGGGRGAQRRAARPLAGRAAHARRQARAGRHRVGRPALDPRQSIDALVDTSHRLRAIGTIASTLCQVAAARLDGMTTLRRCRAVDAAAGQLIVREAGGLVAFTAFDDPLGAPLDLEPHSPVVAARTEAALRELAGVTAV